MSEAEQNNLFKELDARNAEYFLGDDTTTDGLTVFEAYEKTIEAMETLYDPTPEGEEPVPFESFAKHVDG